MNLRECYVEIHGSYEEMMNRLPREASIIKYLRKFAENTEFDELLAAYGEGNYRRIFELAHDLKGMAANFSITEFQAVISDICEACRNGEPENGFDELIEKAKAEHKAVVDAIALLED